MLVSLHLPKTAGTSFALALDKRFGRRLKRDYGDFPLNTPVSIRNEAALRMASGYKPSHFSKVECVHGHFLPVKYLDLAQLMDVTFITWMRNPVDRIISHYNFWRNKYNPQKSPPLHKKMAEENWSLERFCLGGELRNLYSQFLWQFPFEKFDFIGITEHYDEDFEYFSRNYLKKKLPLKRANIGVTRSSSGEDMEILRERIAEYHAEDMNLYFSALKKRAMRGGAR